jgi:hypothetical protein
MARAGAPTSEGIRRVATVAGHVPNERPIARQHELDEDGRVQALSIWPKLTRHVQSGEVRAHPGEPLAQHEVVLALLLVEEAPLGEVGRRLVAELRGRRRMTVRSRERRRAAAAGVRDAGRRTSVDPGALPPPP